MSFKLILFDADDTLFDFTKAEEYALENAFKEFNLEYNKNNHLNKFRTINKTLWGDFEQGKVTIPELRVERFKRFFKELGMVLDYNKFNDSYTSFLIKGTFLINGAEELCNYLYGKYNLAIITNGAKDVQHYRFDSSPLKKYFSHIIVSDEAGYQKPNTGIFEYTFKRLCHSDKNSVLIVGDSLTADIQGGINCGIKTCWFNPQGIQNSTSLKPDYEIKSLSELMELL
ncbi:haloacid dehalogenase [Clostridium polyendosporum]|uniref:Haloacid dehalogenase n=1 Tax=Clostridium polyendosporum TaxID=69208 RepID=A0A919VFM9_9CLOT|nr:YjjG family noncanonical pyrimidine nucleotidase [Clostridium polyendosporum]GIM27661.1 haloacid dehalogenase [Clostridium polyendosporum]